ncbi:calcium/sodium antiporter [Sedimentibacter sp. MB31-C6]|uniref:calcium/sodium antiporter n=1 Tax=Sedimentibacter sp. MB31-C6 TaxID=3109366 RepID=UPI002DDCE226|nr:calcium/sodium antiporter [Sedimentibacter sp. MB36-C1]WSI05545.1 calcium/sodium antiporter [Sedimentibacter sp. MB36-C1]
MLLSAMLFLVGIFFLVRGGDIFVDSSVKLSRYLGLSQVLVGATIVSMATTLPELIVSSTAAIHGETTMSVGNAIGSIICNTGFVLAISSILGNIVIKDEHFKLKSITLISYIIILITCSIDGIIKEFEAIILLGLMLFYLYNNVKSIADGTKIKMISKNTNKNSIDMRKIIIIFILGLILIMVGSNLVVHNGVKIAEYLKVPTAVISLTIIAMGTSLPELVTVITSLLKGNEEIGLGNIIGANILNISLVIGTSGMFSDLIIIPQNLTLDLPVSLLLCILLVVPSLFIKRVSKLQGYILLSIYISYITYIVQIV